MSRKTNIASLAGRVIESVRVFHDDGNENPIALEINCVGGFYASIELTARVTTEALVTIGDNRTGDLQGIRRRKFLANGTVPYGPSE